MKLSKKIIVAAGLFTLLVASLFAQAGLKGKDPVMNTGTPEVIDTKVKHLGLKFQAGLRL